MHAPLLLAEGGEDCFFNATKTAKRLAKLVAHTDIRIDSKGTHASTAFQADIAAFLKARGA